MFWISSHFKKASWPKKRLPSQGGFGLIELMISISIMVLVSAVILVRQSSFNGAVLLRNQAYQIALAARETQLNAVSVSGVTGDYRTLMGVHFDTNNKNEYKIFQDGVSNNGYFNAGEELGEQGVIDPRFSIRAIRVVGQAFTGSTISVVFERPNFDARFFSGPNTELTSASSVEIDISKRNNLGTGTGDVRTIEITSTGQITVQ